MLVRLLPGLYVTGVTLALCAAVRRWLDPLPWRVTLATLTLVLATFAPVLLGGAVLLPLDNLRGYAPFTGLPAPPVHGNYLQGDLVELIAPQVAQVRAALDRRAWPLINPLAGTGLPLLADPQAQAFQPLQVLALPFSLPRAAAVVAALRVVAAILFTFLFLRRQRLDDGPALAGAFAWGFGGYLLLWLGWPLANVAAWLPATLWTTSLVLDRGSRRDLAALASMTLALALAGHPETIVYAATLVVAFALARTRRLAASRASAPWRSLGRATAAASLGALLALPVVLPAAHAAQRSERAAALLARRSAPPGTVRVASHGWEKSWARFALGRTLPLVAPNAFGNDRFGHYWGPENSNEDASGFAGSAALLLALSGAFAAARFRRPEERLLQGAVLGALFLVTLPPMLRPWVDRLPLVLQSTSYFHRLFLVVGFGLACLAACQVDRAVRGEGRRWPVLVVAAALAFLVVWGTLAHPAPADPSTLAVLRLGWLRWHLRFLAATSAVVLLLWRRSWAGPVIAALVAAELLLAHAPANPPMPAALAFRRVPAIAFLAEHLDVQDGQRLVGIDGALAPNLASLFGLADVRVYDPMAPADCSAAVASVAHLASSDLGVSAGAVRERLRTLGVRFLVAPPGTPAPLGFRLVFADATATVFEGLAHPFRGSTCQDGGWHVIANGRPASAASSAGPFVRAVLPPTAAAIELLYRPPGFLLGCSAAAVGATGLLLLALTPPVRSSPLHPRPR